MNPGKATWPPDPREQFEPKTYVGPLPKKSKDAALRVVTEEEDVYPTDDYPTTLAVKAKYQVDDFYVSVDVSCALPGTKFQRLGFLMFDLEEFEVFRQENSQWRFEEGRVRKS